MQDSILHIYLSVNPQNPSATRFTEKKRMKFKQSKAKPV